MAGSNEYPLHLVGSYFLGATVVKLCRARAPWFAERSDATHDRLGPPGDLSMLDVRDILKQAKLSRDAFLKLL